MNVDFLKKKIKKEFNINIVISDQRELSDTDCQWFYIVLKKMKPKTDTFISVYLNIEAQSFSFSKTENPTLIMPTTAKKYSLVEGGQSKWDMVYTVAKQKWGLLLDRDYRSDEDSFICFKISAGAGVCTFYIPLLLAFWDKDKFHKFPEVSDEINELYNLKHTTFIERKLKILSENTQMFRDMEISDEYQDYTLNKLNNFKDALQKNKKIDAEYRLSNIDLEIQEFKRLIDSKIREKKEIEMRLFYLAYQKDNILKRVEDVKNLFKEVDGLHLVDCTDKGLINLVTTGTLCIFQESYIDECVKVGVSELDFTKVLANRIYNQHNCNKVLASQVAVKIFNEMFIARNLEISVVSAFTVDFVNQRFSILRDSALCKRYSKGVLNPHLMKYKCWVESRNRAEDFLRNDDWCSALMQLLDANNSLNVCDVTVMRFLADNLMSNSKDIDVMYKSNAMNFKEAIDQIILEIKSEDENEN